MRSWSICVVLAVVLLTPAGAADRRNGLVLEVYPRQAFAPATVQVTVFVDLDADMQRLTVEAESGMFYRRSDKELEGRNAARLHVVRWRGLPAGEYTVTATVTSAGGRQEWVKDHVNVVP
jgi:hypothetical protein